VKRDSTYMVVFVLGAISGLVLGWLVFAPQMVRV